MSNEKTKEWEGRQGEARKIIEQAGEQFKGQALPSKKLEAAKERLQADAGQQDLLEAAGFTEEIITFLNDHWNAREFTVEQRVFSITLAAINLRQTLPDDKGGTELFDRVNRLAIEYYKKNA